jgi:hypothetical protein
MEMVVTLRLRMRQSTSYIYIKECNCGYEKYTIKYSVIITTIKNADYYQLFAVLHANGFDY